MTIADSLLKALMGNGSLPDTTELFNSLTTILGLLTSVNHALNMRRRELIMPDMHRNYQTLQSAKKVPLTTQLFGDDLEKTVDDITKANRVGKKMNRKCKFGEGFTSHSYSNIAKKGMYYNQRQGRGAFRGLHRGRGSLYHRRFFFRTPSSQVLTPSK